jgi:hypothetical protein
MAHIFQPHVRETSITTGTVEIVLAGAMNQSLRFAQVMATGDTCDYVIMYANTFEEGLGTLNASGHLERTTPSKSLHANGTIDQNRVSFAPGLKTVIMTFRSDRLGGIVAAAAGALRFDIAQSLSAPQMAQARANAPPFASGAILIFPGISTAPVLWTRLTDHHDKALRLIGGAGAASSGGSLAFSTAFARTATDNFTITQSHLPIFTLPDTIGVSDSRTWTSTNAMHPSGGGPFGLPGGSILGLAGAQPISVTGSIGKTGSVTSGGSGSALAAGMDMRVQYLDAIRCQKD